MILHLNLGPLQCSTLIGSPQPEKYDQTVGQHRQQADQQVGEQGQENHRGGGWGVGGPVTGNYLKISQLTRSDFIDQLSIVNKSISMKSNLLL